jgi:DNA-binding XRE family transcriptional regulator
MTILYDLDRDYAEVFFKKEKNYGESVDEVVTVFKSERSDKTVGYSFEEASHSLFESDLLAPSVKLAVLLKIIRAKESLSQSQTSKKIGITLRHYQRLEAGEENPTLGTIESIMGAFPDADFSLILKHPPKAG